MPEPGRALSGTSKQTVFVVDDDDAVRDSLAMLLRSVGLPVETFDSGIAFMDRFRPDLAGCLVLDIRMPKMSGLEVQQKLHELGATLPVIFITGHGDIPMAVQAIKEGAADFIQKPFRDQDLLDRIHVALEQDVRQRSVDTQRATIASRYESLTEREREVMLMVVAGKANKVIALDLDLSQRTVEIHRARVMEKMQARSLADLVKMAIDLGVTH
ncbi:MAG: response regulator transcription factor [Gammaproteobacteria bacterium]